MGARMNDLIYRQDAIGIADDLRDYISVDGYWAWTERLKSLPTAQPEWIPCSEKYPDMDERVLVYTVGHEYHIWDCMSNRSDPYFWEDEEGLPHHKYAVDEWMPLPEPYKGERDD